MPVIQSYVHRLDFDKTDSPWAKFQDAEYRSEHKPQPSFEKVDFIINFAGYLLRLRKPGVARSDLISPLGQFCFWNIKKKRILWLGVAVLMRGTRAAVTTGSCFLEGAWPWPRNRAGDSRPALFVGCRKPPKMPSSQ